MAAGRGRPVWQKHFLLPLNGFAFLGVDPRHDFTPPAACVHIERLSGLNLSLVGHPRDRGLTPGHQQVLRHGRDTWSKLKLLGV